MDVLEELGEAISKAGKTHCAYVHFKNDEPSSDSIARCLRGKADTKYVHLIIRDSTKFVLYGDLDTPHDVKSLYNVIATWTAADPDPTCLKARCVISGFHHLDVSAQSSLIESTRGLRESSTGQQIQVILIGSWNHLRVRSYWKECRLSASPAPERHNVFQALPVGNRYVLERLTSSGLMAHQSSPMELSYCEALLESTGGNRFLIDHIASTMRQQKRPITDLESAIRHVAESEAVLNHLQACTSHISQEGWRLLKQILDQIYVDVFEDDPIAEDLRIAGLVFTIANGAKRTLSISSPLLESIMRANWNKLPGAVIGCVYPGDDLSSPVMAVNLEAFKLVAKIENILRNLTVLNLTTTDISWQQQIEHIKTGAFVESETSDEAVMLLKKILSMIESTAPTPNEQPTNQLANSAQDEFACSNIQRPSSKKALQVSIITSAGNWRSRQNQCTALELSGNSLAYFLTTEDLVKIFLTKELYSKHWIRFFPNKNELATFLEHYVVVRAAVAHNQPVNFATLRRLEEQFRALQRRICMAKTA